MENKRIIWVIAAAAVIIFVITCLLYLLIPDEKHSMIEPVKYNSMEEYKESKLQESFSDVLDNYQKALTVTMDEAELNEILALQYKEMKEKGTDIPEITGFKGEINEGKIKIYMDSMLMGIIPTQYAVELVPGIENNKIILFLSKARAGQIPLSKKLVLNIIRRSDNQEFTVDVDKANLVLNNNLPKQFAFKSIIVRDKRIDLEVGVFIQSIDDLLEVIGTILPKGLKDIIDMIPVESLTKEGAELLKNITLKQVDNLVNSIKTGVINDSIKNITSAENIEKVKEKLKDTTIDSIKSAAEKAAKSLEKNIGSTSVGESGLKEKIVDAVKDKLSSESIDKKIDILKGVLNSVRKK